MNQISSKTTIGSIALAISDMERSLNYYLNQLGFRLHDQTNKTTRLGTNEHELLLLEERPGSSKKDPTTGLYHMAIRVPNRDALSNTLYRLVETAVPFQGFADHGVSEAIYLEDPDGNGIEIYRDRPIKDWPMKDGQLEMITDPLNVESLLASADPNSQSAEKLPEGTTIGHIHLKVSHMSIAVSFYRDILGFALTQRYGPSAAFFSTGGYHHHIGINTWTSAGAPPPPPNTTGLQWYSIDIPNEDNFQELIQRISDAKIPLQESDFGLFVQDPSNNKILLKGG
ncbi:MAG: VOC family protein [Anaerolineales bacterium]|jgi:catechol 2,3-dioxygenase